MLNQPNGYDATVLTPTDGARIENVDIDLHAETGGLVVSGSNTTVDGLHVRTHGFDGSNRGFSVCDGEKRLRKETYLYILDNDTWFIGASATSTVEEQW